MTNKLRWEVEARFNGVQATRFVDAQAPDALDAGPRPARTEYHISDHFYDALIRGDHGMRVAQKVAGSSKINLMIRGIKVIATGMSRTEASEAARIIDENYKPHLKKIGKNGWIVYSPEGDVAVIHKAPGSGIYELRLEKQQDGTISFKAKAKYMKMSVETSGTYDETLTGTLYDLHSSTPFVPKDAPIARFDPRTTSGQKGLLKALEMGTDDDMAVALSVMDGGTEIDISRFTNTTQEIRLVILLGKKNNLWGDIAVLNGFKVEKELYANVIDTLQAVVKLHPKNFGGLSEGTRDVISKTIKMFQAL